MKLMRFGGPVLLALTLVAGLAPPAAAQTIVSTAEIQRLQDNIYDVSRDVSQLWSRDATLASQLQADLDDARDDAIYYKVKLRRHETVSRSDFNALRDRVESIRSRVRSNAMSGSTGVSPTPRVSDSSDRRATSPTGRASANEIPSGTEFDVRLEKTLSSETAQVEDRFDATTVVDLRDSNGRVLVPAGSTMRGVVSSVNKAGRIERKGSLTVAFDRVTISGRSYPMHGTVTQALESEGIKGEAEKIGVGAGAGAILGAILGGAKGALAGILIGGGGVVAATEGKDVTLPIGTILRVRLDSPLVLSR